VTGPLLGERASSRQNNFDLVRLGAAALVVVTHCWSLTGRPEPQFLGNTLGTLGVVIFFAISGFLIARSWDLDRRAHAYAVKRFLRLWPALAVVVIVSALVVGPLTTKRPFHPYLVSGTSSYITSNLALRTRNGIHGAFAGNPVGGGITGTLWTIPVEVKAYALLLVLALLGLVRRPLMLVALVVALAWVLRSPPDYQHSIVGRWLEAPLQTFMLMVFLGGALLYALRDRVRLDWRLAALAALLFCAAPHAPGALRPLAVAVSVPFLAAMIAYRTPRALNLLTKPGDVSYGIYLWAFPVQQTVIYVAGGTLGPGRVLLATIPLAYAIALCSWRLIEAPALALKQRLRRPPDGDRRRRFTQRLIASQSRQSA
jgi:peptidoglycan/LPS O-acetylase OafA/YrhL